jgi:hypothetical protein
VFGGYDFMVLTGVSKPFDNIYYNSVTDALGDRTADINQVSNLQNLARLWIQRRGGIPLLNAFSHWLS